MTKRYPELIEHLPRSMQIMISIFVKRLDSGKNCLVAIVGGTGSGKSFASVCILYWTYVYMHGKYPSMEYMRDRWFFESAKFLDAMNNPDLKKKDLNLWDEMGVSASHKAHATIQNRAIGWLVQTFRNLEQLVIFTVPTLAYVDKTVRNLLHYQLETRKVLISDKICIIKPLEIQYNIRMDKTYYHNLSTPSKDGSGFMDEVDVVGVPLPPPEFIKAYEEKSWKFKAELNKRIQGMIENVNLKEKKESLVGEEAIIESLPVVQKKVWELIGLGHNSTAKLRDECGIPHSSAYDSIRAFRRKGLDVDKYLEKEKSQNTILKNRKTDPRTKLTYKSRTFETVNNDKKDIHQPIVVINEGETPLII